MFYRSRSNRRRMDKRKRKRKYNLYQSINGDAEKFLGGVLGKYDKGKIHDTERYHKTNGRVALNDSYRNTYCKTLHKLGNNYSHTDKRKVIGCNDQLNEHRQHGAYHMGDMDF